MRDELEALLKNYKLHNKDIDACFNDAVAVTHLITSIINLVDKEVIGEDEALPEWGKLRIDIRNELRAEMRENAWKI